MAVRALHPAVVERPRTSIERTPDGLRLVVERSMRAAPAAVWRVVRDTHHWPEWGPSITAVDCADRFVERGSTGYVTTVGGLRLPFKVTSCADGRWTWDVAGLPATGHRVRTAADRTVAAFEVPLAAAPYAFVCRKALGRLNVVARDDERAAAGDDEM